MTPAGIGGPAGVWDAGSTAVAGVPAPEPDRRVSSLPRARRPVTLSEPRTFSSEANDNGVRRVVFRDADGNEFAFGGLPVDNT